jgi:hypothetical protein
MALVDYSCVHHVTIFQLCLSPVWWIDTSLITQLNAYLYAFIISVYAHSISVLCYILVDRKPTHTKHKEHTMSLGQTPYTPGIPPFRTRATTDHVKQSAVQSCPPQKPLSCLAYIGEQQNLPVYR